MNTIPHIFAISALAAGMGMAVPVSSFAQAATDHSAVNTSQAPASMTEGEVKKVDQETGKVTIKHGTIQHLDMPGMTMVFTVKDKGLLANVKAGDKVLFRVVSEGGKLLVTDIQAAR